MSITRRLFLRTSAVTGIAAAVATPAAAEPKMTPLENATWHIRELERLISEAGYESPVIFACSHYTNESGNRDVKAFGLRHGRIDNDDGIFQQEGGAK
ncbi:MAG: twin-arginine translocation signal domain-containing protein [Rhizobiaceae bacterium]